VPKKVMMCPHISKSVPYDFCIHCTTLRENFQTLCSFKNAFQIKSVRRLVIWTHVWCHRSLGCAGTKKWVLRGSKLSNSEEVFHGSSRKMNRASLIGASVILAVGFLYYATTRLNITIVLSEVAHSLSVSQLAVAGLISTMTLFGIAIFSFVFGAVADTVGKWKVMVVGLFAMGAFTLATAYANTIDSMLAARFLVGVSEGLYQPSYYAFLGAVFSNRRGLAMGVFSGLFAVGIAINPPITIYFYGLANDSWRLSFVYMGLLGFALGAVALISSGLIRPLEPPNTKPTERSTAKKAWFRDPSLLAILGAMASLGLTQYAFLGVMPTYLREYQHMSQSQAANIISVSGWSAFIVGMIGGLASDKVGRIKIIAIYGVANILVSYPLFPFSTDPTNSLILSSLFQGFHGSLTPLGIALAQDIARERTLATNSGAALGSSFFAGGFSGAITGWLATAKGFEAVGLMFLLSALVTLVCFLVVGPLTRPKPTPAPRSTGLRPPSSVSDPPARTAPHS
jgi:MFS family permease